MERYIVAAAGGLIALAAAVFLVRLLLLNLTGGRADAEVVAVKEPERGSYIHRLRYEVDGKYVESDDKTGYTQPFSKGDIRQIVYKKSDPAKFEYAEQLKKNIIITAILMVMAVLIVLRFMFFVRDGELEEDIQLTKSAIMLIK